MNSILRIMAIKAYCEMVAIFRLGRDKVLFI